jgi:hypothetical protein
MAYDNVVAAWTEGIAGPHDHRSIARRIAHAAHRFESAHDAGPEQMPVMHAVLGDDIVVEPVEIFIGEQLAGEKSRPA